RLAAVRAGHGRVHVHQVSGHGLPLRPQVTVRAWSLMVTVLPVREMVAPLPLVIVIPLSLITSIAPPAVLSVMPGPPGTSESTMVCWPWLCRPMFGWLGDPASASGGTSADVPHQHPDQIG